MDYGVYDLDFTREGRRRVYLFSYLLGYSRRQYLRFVESMDLPTTLREHVHAFHHLGGVARVCLYDNFKAVVLRHDADGPLYNPKFLAFATHYGFRPQACRVRRPQTKGKVERQVLLRRNQLAQRPHLRHAGASQRSDRLVAAKRRRRAASCATSRNRRASVMQREQPHLLPLPTCDFDTALVVYRHVNVEGFVTHRLNFYSVPWSYIGQVLPVRVTENEVIIYSIGLEEIARHPLRAQHADRRAADASRAIIPPTIPDQRDLALAATLRRTRPGRRAVPRRPARPSRSRASCKPSNCWRWSPTTSATMCCRPWSAPSASAPSPWPPSAASSPPSAQPKPLLDELADLHRDALDPRLREEPIGPRPTSDYQHLLSPEEATDEPPSEEKPPADEPDRRQLRACVTRSSPTSRPCASP